MSIYDKASLVLIPSGTKTSKVYSQKPVNGDGDFTFSRSTAATRVNADGNIEKETQNLLTYSKNLASSGWSGSGCTSTSAADFDGGNNANQLTSSSSNGFWYQAFSGTGVQTLSIYAKAGTGNFLRLRLDSSTSPNVYFDLSNGTITAQTSNIDATITAVSGASGWYRCTLTGNVSSPNNVRIYPTQNTNLIVYKVQLEQGMVARDYIETTTAAVEGGITDNVPRLDYTDSSCPALLLEPQRTNLLTQSEYFGVWGINAGGISSIEPNYAISPEGVENAYKVNFVVQGDSDLALFKGHSVTGGATYAYSIYIKGEGSDIGKDIVVKSKRSGGDSASTITTQTLTGEWVRVDFTTTYAANNTAANFFISSNDATSCLIYGAQIEAGSYATSYIPTYGTSVTRNADAASKTGISSLIGQTEGTLFAEFEINADNTNGFNRVLAVGDGTSNNRIFIFAQDTKVFRFYVANGGAAQVDIVSTTSILGGRHKVAFAYKANDFIAYVDGVQVGIDTSGTIPSCSNVYIGTHEAGSTQPLEGGINQALLFKTRLSNEELAALTTI
jgi:hypothetical protein